MTSPIVLSGITKLFTHTACTIDEDGNIITEGVVRQDGESLTIDAMGLDGDKVASDAAPTSISGSNTSANNSTSFTVDDTMVLNGIRIISSNNTLLLASPATSTLVIDKIERQNKSVALVVSCAPPRTKYQLSASCLLTLVNARCGGVSTIAAKFLDYTLTVGTFEWSVVHLPEKTFDDLKLTSRGCSAIVGTNTKTHCILAAVYGNGVIKHVWTDGSGVAIVHGSGEISITAVNPLDIFQKAANGGRVEVSRATTAPRVVGVSKNNKRAAGPDLANAIKREKK